MLVARPSASDIIPASSPSRRPAVAAAAIDADNARGCVKSARVKSAARHGASRRRDLVADDNRGREIIEAGIACFRCCEPQQAIAGVQESPRTVSGKVSSKSRACARVPSPARQPPARRVRHSAAALRPVPALAAARADDAASPDGRRPRRSGRWCRGAARAAVRRRARLRMSSCSASPPISRARCSAHHALRRRASTSLSGSGRGRLAIM